MSIEALFFMMIAFIFGGLLKGATGAGAPILAVPAMALFFDVQFAVAAFVIPNILTNLWQAWQMRHDLPCRRLVWPFALSGMLGALGGSVALAYVHLDILTLGIASVMLLYIGFRYVNPRWKLSMLMGVKLAVPAGLIGGFLQGASGVSAPVSITFLSAMHLARKAFIATISIFFLMMGAVQVPSLIYLGILTSERALFSCVALIPLFAFMPVGAMLARFLSPERFNQMLLALLFLLAMRLIYSVVV
jgi:uncharacterized membrane protein YfcA